MDHPKRDQLGLQRDPDEWQTGDEPMTAPKARTSRCWPDNNGTFDENSHQTERIEAY
jgi:hypothetical protein